MIIKNLKFGNLFVLTILGFSPSIFARVHDFETARLKSQGGAGIGSVLLNESVVLNPAPLAVFSDSTATYQRENLKLQERNPNHDKSPNSFNQETHTNALIVAEGGSKIKGAFAYTDQAEGFDKRQRLSTSLAGHLTDLTSIGINYRFTKESSMNENNGNRFDYHSVGLGLMHFYSNNLSIGLVMDDLAKSKGKNTKGGIGIQYVAQDLVTLMADIGTNYAKNFTNFMYYKTAAQFKLVSDVYARFGLFTDQMNQEKGYGWGGGWVGPKLDLELGIKTFKPTKDPSFSLLKGENQKELAMSLSYIF